MGHLCGSKNMLILHSSKAKPLFSFDNENITYVSDCKTIFLLFNVLLLCVPRCDFNLLPEQLRFFCISHEFWIICFKCTKICKENNQSCAGHDSTIACSADFTSERQYRVGLPLCSHQMQQRPKINLFTVCEHHQAASPRGANYHNDSLSSENHTILCRHTHREPAHLPRSSPPPIFPEPLPTSRDPPTISGPESRVPPPRVSLLADTAAN